MFHIIMENDTIVTGRHYYNLCSIIEMPKVQTYNIINLSTLPPYHTHEHTYLLNRIYVNEFNDWVCSL